MRARAHDLTGCMSILDDLLTTLGAPATATMMSDFIAGRSDPALHMLDTMTLIDAWAYYKRFAVSILGVEAGEDSEPIETQQHAEAGAAES